MKKITLVFMITSLLLGFCNESFAQKKCKYESDITDPISGERHRIATTRLLEPTSTKISVSAGPPKPYNNALLKFHNIGGKYNLELHIKFIGNLHKYTIPAGTELRVKLQNDKIITLFSNAEIIPKHGTEGYQMATTFSILFESTEAQMNEIIDGGGIKAIGTSFNSESISKIVKEKDIPKTVQRAKCITSK